MYMNAIKQFIWQQMLTARKHGVKLMTVLFTKFRVAVNEKRPDLDLREITRDNARQTIINAGLN
jgi:hypothetical protein